MYVHHCRLSIALGLTGTLQKAALKEITKLTKSGDEDDDSEGEGKKKEKVPNIHRMMKNRLQKLTEYKDDQ